MRSIRHRYPNGGIEEMGQLKIWLNTVGQDKEVVLGPSVLGLHDWQREWIELSRSAATDRHARRDTICDIIEAG
ncbi:unnamed protein product [Schistocephalus solidus]|uniref:Integrase n=1 Tax=Schistocephalus solidus TaxID=70667 RepID=A0A183SR45_SCHSO|nr:unnamed protein product [Schistocephalus solidus]